MDVVEDNDSDTSYDSDTALLLDHVHREGAVGVERDEMQPEATSELESVNEQVASSFPQATGSQPASIESVSHSSEIEEKSSVDNKIQGDALKHGGVPDDDDDGDDGRTCPICMDVWSNSGNHRLASLRCGHLFGHSCILRWLQVGCVGGQRRCPQCNKKAHMKDIRLHYARKLQVLDTAKRDRLKEELENVQREKNRLELELARANLNHQLHQQQLAELRLKLAQVQSAQCLQTTGRLSQQMSQRNCAHLSLVHSVDICKDGGCRVLAYNAWLNLLIVSQRSSNHLFSGYGIKKIDALEFRPTQFVFLHPKAIRDMAFHPQRNDMLLSVSLDRCAKLFNVSNNAVVQSYTTDSPLWSCCWDADNSNLLFVGTSNGAVLQYDVRYSNEPMSRLTSLDDSSPVTSLGSIPSCPGRTMSRGGFLACKLNSCWAYERRDADYIGSQLPFDGPFVSLCYDRSTEHVLISTRPSARYPHARHIVCQLPQTNGGLESHLICTPVHTFKGSTSQKLLSRPCQVSVPGDTLVAAHQESLKSVALWSTSSGKQILSSPASQPVIDLCPVQVNSSQYLAALSEKVLSIYSIK